MAVTITVNSSPFSGLEGKNVTSTKIRNRLLSEAESNVAITFKENEDKQLYFTKMISMIGKKNNRIDDKIIKKI